MSKNSYKIVVLPGDGIGRDVTPEGVKALEAASEIYDINFEFEEFACGGQYFLETGREWDEGAFDACKDADAIFLGAVGWPGANLPDGNIAGAGIIFGLRFGLDLYANVRPTKLYPGIKHKVHDERKLVWQPGKVDLITVRENTEGLYSPLRGRLSRGGISELAVDSRVITRKGSERVIEYAFKLAERRERGSPKDGVKRVTCVDKANVLEGCRLFRSIYKEIAERHPSIQQDFAYIDAYTQWLVRTPDWFNVSVTTNMLGDIASDLSAVLGGSLGMAPSGNIGDKHAFFEPVHGSAPKHAGKDKANPMAMILSGSMLLDYLGDKFNDSRAVEAGKALEKAVEKVVLDGKTLTYDLGGTSRCSEVGSAVASVIRNSE